VSSTHSDDVTRERLGELANDLRVALPGAQVLFAFLLTLPFTTRFDVVAAGLEKGVYFVAFISSVLASVFLIAPSALHRVFHELRDPGGLALLLRTAGYLAVAGSFFLAISMGAVVFLITDALYTRTAASLVAAAVLALVAFLWFALPLLHKMAKLSGARRHHARSL
jgi:hypothetical protein